MPQVPTIWCAAKMSTDFARIAATFIGLGFGSFDDKRESLHHGLSWMKTKSRVVAKPEKFPAPK